MSAELRVLVPGEPVAKERPKMNRATGNVYTPKETKVAEAAMAWHLRTVRGRRPMFAGEVEVELLFALGPDRGKADIDNLIKLVLDAGNKVLWKDDRQVARVVVDLYRFDPRPRTVVTVRASERASAQRTMVALPPRSPRREP